MRLSFPAGGDTAVEAARLATAELACYEVVEFTLELARGTTVLTIRAPDVARAVLIELVGG